MLCSTPVDQSRSRQASFSYTAHHLAVYEKRQVTQNLFISTQCQGGSGKRKCSFTMSRLNFRDLIEQLLSSIFRPVTKREILLNTVSLFFTIKYLGGKWFYGRFGGICQLQRTLLIWRHKNIVWILWIFQYCRLILKKINGILVSRKTCSNIPFDISWYWSSQLFIFICKYPAKQPAGIVI